MPRKKDEAERTLLANSVTSWKSLHKVTADPYVEGLLEGLNSGKNLEMWASLNPLEYLPHPQIIISEKFHRLLFIISIIRNALVFSPVALTWLAISKATSAFSAYTTENSLTVVNFLDFWENGYGVLSKNWSLSRVATLDFQIIILIISLTIGIGAFERKLNRSREQALEQVDSERIQIALEIITVLSKEQRLTPQVFNSATTSILRNLTSTSKSMERTSKDLAKSLNSQASQRELLAEIKNLKTRIMRDSE
jgi:hypothetical protein